MTRRKKVYLLETDNGFTIRIVNPDISFMKKFKWVFTKNNLIIRQIGRGKSKTYKES